MLLLMSALLVAATVAWSGVRIARALEPRGARNPDRLIHVFSLFAPAVVAASDPRAVVAWQRLALTARKLFASEFAALDHASGSVFPFSEEQLHAVHAQWTADWLAWERTHDAEYKLKAAGAEEELRVQGSSPYARAKLEAVEREKLERYQRRYEEYTRVSKALHALIAQR